MPIHFLFSSGRPYRLPHTTNWLTQERTVPVALSTPPKAIPFHTYHTLMAFHCISPPTLLAPIQVLSSDWSELRRRFRRFRRWPGPEQGERHGQRRTFQGQGGRTERRTAPALGANRKGLAQGVATGVAVGSLRRDHPVHAAPEQDGARHDGTAWCGCRAFFWYFGAPTLQVNRSLVTEPP